MLKVGDILWTFSENTYSVGEISELSVVSIGEKLYYFISTDGIIGTDQKIFILTTEDLNTLVTVRYSTTTYYTTSEKEAIKFIESHYND
jgi:hypothetical protein